VERGRASEPWWSVATSRAIAPVCFAGSEEPWGDRVSSRVPQRGGIEGQWTDVRPRRRKALRQERQSRDRFQEEEERLRVRKDFKLRQSRVRYDLREERYYGDFDTGSEDTARRPLRWGDYKFDEAGSDERSDQHHVVARRDQKDARTLLRRAQQTGTVQRRKEVVMQQKREAADHQKRTVHTIVPYQKRDTAPDSKGAETDTSLKRFVTFYITNFPPQASNFFLRKGFEVCGILEQVFVANTRNRNGEVYGFVRYAKVRDVDKLMKALNNVCFGNYCVCAVLARFDRKVVREDDGARRKKEGVAGGGAKEGLEGEKRKERVMGRSKEGLKVDGGLTKGEEGGVRVGTVLVRVGGAGRKEGEGEGGVDERKASTTKQTTVTKLIRKYRTHDEDLNWAKRGFIGTVIDGASIPLIQNRVEDAGFKDVDIIPIGADKVFVQSLSGADVSVIVDKAREFFDFIFSNLVPWKEEIVSFQRGAWIRLYGIPIHAWNEIFFKLCVMDCGRFLRTDNCSLNRERFDYARVLISTNSLDMVNTLAQILVDGEMVEIKLIEEWGFHLGDDVCLYDEEDKAGSECHENENIHEDFENIEDVEVLANQIVQDLEAANDMDGVQLNDSDKVTVKTTDPIKVLPLGTNGHSASSPTAKHSTENPTISETSVCKDGIRLEPKKQGTEWIDLVEEMTSPEGEPASRVATTVEPTLSTPKTSISCSQGNSGPWSVDWLHNTQEGDTGLISSKNKKLKKVLNAKGGKGGRLSNKQGKKKAGGVLRHPVLTYKKVARLPISDREEVMKALRKSKLMNVVKQKIQNRRQLRDRVTRSLEAVNVNSLNESCSLDSVNNDWSNWVALNGSEVSKAADVQCIGKTLGVSFKGNCHNNFTVLSRHNKGASGPVLTPMADERMEVQEGG